MAKTRLYQHVRDLDWARCEKALGEDPSDAQVAGLLDAVVQSGCLVWRKTKGDVGRRDAFLTHLTKLLARPRYREHSARLTQYLPSAAIAEEGYRLVFETLGTTDAAGLPSDVQAWALLVRLEEMLVLKSIPQQPADFLKSIPHLRWRDSQKDSPPVRA